MFGMYDMFGRNSIDKRKGFYISYNPITDKGPETAIVKDEKFYILLGDWRPELKAKGFKECIKVFLKNQDKRSFWSNDYKEIN